MEMRAARLIRRLAPVIRAQWKSYTKQTATQRGPRGASGTPFTFARASLALFGATAAVAGSKSDKDAPDADANERESVPSPEPQVLVNWSGTHTVHTSQYYTPETLEELLEIVKHAHESRRKLRPVGSALSPNGLPFEPEGMVNLTNMDKILSIDKAKGRVTVQAGATVIQLVEALRPHGLTLPNYASITEQQVGGFTQVGAHGTGVKIPPLDEAVIGLKLVTPAAGVLELSEDDEDPSLFQLARASMGMLGVVAEVSFQCVPAHRLVEQTFVLNRAEVIDRHDDLMRENKHLRYMWIPHTDAVVVVTCNPVKGGETADRGKYSMNERLEGPRKLLKAQPGCKLNAEQIDELSFTTLRDELLSLDPLNVSWVKQVNTVEESFWRKSEGTRVDWSDKILQFDCGGQQWVSEVAFPVPKKAEKTDVKYMKSLLDLIESESVPAPAPIEQRWTAPSLSPMSPAAEKPDRPLPEFYAWVGIIMYLPNSGDEKLRARITEAFRGYKTLCEKNLWQDFKAVEHWAKIEMPRDDVEKAMLQLRTYQKYPVDAFKAICHIFDPHGILRNDLMDAILGVDQGGV